MSRLVPKVVWMKRAGGVRLVLLTAPDLRTARRLVRAALGARLIACANLVPKAESHYLWRGKVERSSEVLLVCKTTVVRLPALEQLVAGMHPYETPEFVVVRPAGVDSGYLRWWIDACSEAGES
jgi:periplasmic divalent cation tolerance protein